MARLLTAILEPHSARSTGFVYHPISCLVSWTDQLSSVRCISWRKKPRNESMVWTIHETQVGHEWVAKRLVGHKQPRHAQHTSQPSSQPIEGNAHSRWKLTVRSTLAHFRTSDNQQAQCTAKLLEADHTHVNSGAGCWVAETRFRFLCVDLLGAT